MEYKWVHRSEEWIKENPGKPTLYKEYFGGFEEVKKEILPGIIRRVVPAFDFPDAGVYLLLCEVEKSVYVGQSKSVGVRMRNHKMNLSGSNDVYYQKMVKHVKKHGIGAFEFIKYKPMPHCDPCELLPSCFKVASS